MANPRVQAVRGTQDIFGEDAARFEHVVKTFDRVRKLYGFRPVHVPMFEFTEVFARSIGETTDVVSKEMYSFEDRGGESLTLRPEFTAGIARAYISNGWQQHAPMKLAAWGAAFRYERPQKGRYRQFHQLDAEIIGAGEPAADVEIIAFAAQLLDELGLGDKVVLQLNTLGDAETRAGWHGALVAHFEANRDALSEESRERLAKNPLRILDSKDPRDRPLVDAAPGIDAHMTAEAGHFFDKVQRGLEAAGVSYARNAALVRGLDYYRHTAFEFVTTHLGAQGTVIGGGRYDGLIESMGGPPTPAVGWAGGIERLAMLVRDARPDAHAQSDKTVELVIIPANDASLSTAQEILSILRRQSDPNLQIVADMAFSGSENKRYDKAKKSGAYRAAVVDTDPAFSGVTSLRIRDLNVSQSEVQPVRARLKHALEQRFSVRDDLDGDRLITIARAQ